MSRFRPRMVREIAMLAAVALVGYGVAVLWTAPAPLFSSDHAVPRVLDLDLAAAQRKLTALGYRVKFAGTRQHPSVPRGRVVAQDPPAGVIMAAGSPVELTTSAGRASVIVPDLVGFAAPQALRVLAAAGLAGAAVDSVTEGADAPGIVIATRPEAGATRDPGATIGLVVSAATVGRP